MPLICWKHWVAAAMNAQLANRDGPLRKMSRNLPFPVSCRDSSIARSSSAITGLSIDTSSKAARTCLASSMRPFLTSHRGYTSHNLAARSQRTSWGVLTDSGHRGTEQNTMTAKKHEKARENRHETPPVVCDKPKLSHAWITSPPEINKPSSMTTKPRCPARLHSVCLENDVSQAESTPGFDLPVGRSSADRAEPEAGYEPPDNQLGEGECGGLQN